MEVPATPDASDDRKRIPEMEVVSSQSSDGGPRLSYLNPSTSRFMLTMPLLGRPKVPLGEAIARSGGSNNSGKTMAAKEEGAVAKKDSKVEAASGKFTAF